MANQIAQTIIDQLGGNKFVAMTGAHQFTHMPSGVTFRIGANAKKVTHLRITLTGDDDYTMEFQSIRGLKPIKMIDHAFEIMADTLASTFARKTGMAVAL